MILALYLHRERMKNPEIVMPSFLWVVVFRERLFIVVALHVFPIR